MQVFAGSQLRIARDNVNKVTGYGLEGRGSIPGRTKGVSFHHRVPDSVWDPRSLHPNEYRGGGGVFPWL
jgi:hypothetical protein